MSSEEPKPDALATTPAFDYGKLGIAIVEKAREQQRAEAKEAVINGVHSILSDIMAQQKIIARAEERIAKQEARIKALEAGEFTIDLLDNSVVFTNRDLKGGGL